ncbi:MAG: ComEC/Rec2 family competence protein [Ferruginibacter sp.]
MHKPYSVPIWKKAPFIRLLVPLITGIIIQWYLQCAFPLVLISSLCFAIAHLLFFLFPLAMRFRLQSMQGLLLNGLLVGLGLLVTWQKDMRNSENWYGRVYHDSDLIVLRVDEPMVEKAKSFKVNGFVEGIIHNNTFINCKGKILLYFSKEPAGDSTGSIAAQLQYGDKILVSKNPQRIKNSGNPGAFNYERYAAFQQVFHHLFLKEKDWVKLEGKNLNRFNQFIFTARDNVLSALQKNISNSKDELGIAQALLIGYTNDLDKDLVQAYSNTGVVHIIAISGMHLGLIYLLLAGLFEKIPILNRSRLLKAMLILGCLWLFSLLTGASASVLRSAVMFSFITVGTIFKKKSSIYNSLAASAFLMLCYNPYFLWDVGFQLSYLAVVSIIVFQKPVYNCWYIKNNLADKIWKLTSISLAAQILTFPVCIYYFHQFPNFFLLTNIIAVPLSSIILYAEIGLMTFSWVPAIGSFIGKAITWLVWLMNKIVLRVSEFPFSVWEGIPSTLLSTLLLYAMVIGFSVWLIKKNLSGLWGALICLSGFVMVHAYNSWQINNQQKLIVYNVPQHRAIDFISGNDFYFIGDSILLQDGLLHNLNLKPARIALQLRNNRDSLKSLFQNKSFFQFCDKRILLIDRSLDFEIPPQKAAIDIIIISKNPSLQIARLASVFHCRQYIFDASNSLWKIDKWQKDCEELHLRSYSVLEKGAFVLDAGE